MIEERGNLPIYHPERWGFTPDHGGSTCWLSHPITKADWAALNRRFELPPTIWFRNGIIRDQQRRIEFIGWYQIQGSNGMRPIEEWEREERQLGRTYGRPGVDDWRPDEAWKTRGETVGRTRLRLQRLRLKLWLRSRALRRRLRRWG